MNFDSDLFERIRIKPDPEVVARRGSPRCDWEGCEAAGTHPAPKGRGHEGEYHRFCIDHVRLYNKSYNYFSGLGDEIRARYKDLVKRHHPDANGGDRSSEGRLQEIIQAYKLLRTAGLV